VSQYNQEEFSKETFGLWKTLPITKAVIEGLREEKQNLMDMLSTGQTLRGKSGDTAEATARTVGMIEGIDLILNIEYQEEGGVSYGLSD